MEQSTSAGYSNPDWVASRRKESVQDFEYRVCRSVVERYHGQRLIGHGRFKALSHAANATSIDPRLIGEWRLLQNMPHDSQPNQSLFPVSLEKAAGIIEQARRLACSVDVENHLTRLYFDHARSYYEFPLKKLSHEFPRTIGRHYANDDVYRNLVASAPFSTIGHLLPETVYNQLEHLARETRILQNKKLPRNRFVKAHRRQITRTMDLPITFRPTVTSDFAAIESWVTTQEEVNLISSDIAEGLDNKILARWCNDSVDPVTMCLRGEPAGFCTLSDKEHSYPPGHLELCHFVIAPELRRRYLGTTLLNYMRVLAAERGYQLLHGRVVPSNDPALKFANYSHWRPLPSGLITPDFQWFTYDLRAITTQAGSNTIL